jgi:8-oxo-dGTP diphosphatase
MDDLINVTAAILFYNGRLLIAKRKETGKLPNVWEFPGGKIESGETPEDCLKREMEEEFGIGVTTGDHFGESIYHYDHGSIKLLVYRTTWVAGEFTIRDHQAIEWVSIDDLTDYDFAPADKPFVEKLMSGEIML